MYGEVFLVLEIWAGGCVNVPSCEQLGETSSALFTIIRDARTYVLFSHTYDMLLTYVQWSIPCKQRLDSSGSPPLPVNTLQLRLSYTVSIPRNASEIYAEANSRFDSGRKGDGGAIEWKKRIPIHLRQECNRNTRAWANFINEPRGTNEPRHRMNHWLGSNLWFGKQMEEMDSFPREIRSDVSGQ